MPLGYPGFSSSDTSNVGSKYTRLQGPVLVGQRLGAGNVDMVGGAPHVFNVSTGNIDVFLAPPGGSTSAVFLTTAATAGFQFITQTSVTRVPDGGTPTMQGGFGGVAITWDSGAKTIEVWSSVTNAWMRAHSTSGAAVVWSSS